jgi:Co/Zn/Cd efflux system component
MDCPSEEQMIRLALNGLPGIHELRFDLRKRRLEVVHGGAVEAISQQLAALRLGAVLEHTRTADAPSIDSKTSDAGMEAREATALRLLLAINATMFGVELFAGWVAQSAALLADALDMLADAVVYGLSLYAVGRSVALQVRAAHVAGYLQLVLAIGVLVEVARRFVFGSEPESTLMMAISLLALMANVACLWLIAQHREGGAHMKASWIFSGNVVLINAGVVVAGALVAWTGSNLPDLVIGTVVGLMVLNGARRILALKG